MGLAWPDIALAIVAIFGTLKGFKRGLINELAGMIAIGFAIGAAFAYHGTFDLFLRDRAHLAPGSAHIAGMVLYAALAYAIVYAIAFALSTVAKLPILGTVNALLGAIAGLVKVTIFAWATLYVALFFPLSADIRDDLHRSHLVALLERSNGGVDAHVRDALPDFVRPFAPRLFEHHRV